MENKSNKKIWLSPVVTISFLAVAVTGILLLVHVKNGPIKVLHEWMGLVFAIAGITHLAFNWGILKAYFKHRGAFLATIIALLLTVLLIIAGLNAKNPHARGPHDPLPTASQERAH